MALSLNFTFGTPCGAGNHVDLTMTLSGAINRSRTVGVTRRDLIDPPTDEDIQAMVTVLLRLMIVQLGTKTAASIKQAVEAKTIDLTVVG